MRRVPSVLCSAPRFPSPSRRSHLPSPGGPCCCLLASVLHKRNQTLCLILWLITRHQWVTISVQLTPTFFNRVNSSIHRRQCTILHQSYRKETKTHCMTLWLMTKHQCTMFSVQKTKQTKNRGQHTASNHQRP